MNIKEIIKLREQASFLGYEFLTWTLLLLEGEDAATAITRITKDLLHQCPVTIDLGLRLTTCLLEHKEQKNTIISPVLLDRHEVFASLRNGHLVESLSLHFLLDELSVTLTLHAVDFAISALKIKNNFDQLSADEALSQQEQLQEEIFLRMKTVEDVEKIVDALFTEFLQMRLREKDYSAYQKASQGQIDQRLSDYVRKNNHALHKDSESNFTAF